MPGFNMYEHSNILGYYLGVDIGGSHISSALMGAGECQLIPESFCRKAVSSKSSSSRVVMDQWIESMKDSISNVNSNEIKGIGIAMPGTGIFKPYTEKTGNQISSFKADCLIIGGSIAKFSQLFLPH